MPTEDQIARAERNAVIKSTFRDTADRDYIAARLLHRAKLTEQFYWSALQAVEKYLKAILLYHDFDTRTFSHDLSKALAAVYKIPKLRFKLSRRARRFIKRLNDEGPNRYFMLPRSTKGDELFDLDHTVWEIRRFCDDFFFPHDHPLNLEYERRRLKYVRGKKIKRARSYFRLDPQRGFLENVLKEVRFAELRRALIWKNFNFGNRQKNRVTYSHVESWAQPSHLIYPRTLTWARARIKMPKEVIKEMEKRLVLT